MTAVRSKHRLVLLLSLVVWLTFLLILWSAFSVVSSYRYLHKHDLVEDRADELRREIQLYDEVLTMSALMAAETGDPAWEARYRGFEPKLAASIRELGTLTPDPRVANAIATTSQANNELLEMEGRALDLVRANKLSEARGILQSNEYSKNKLAYSNGMSTAGAALNVTLKEESDRQHLIMQIGVGASFVLIPSLIVCWLLMLRGARQWQEALEDSTNALRMTNDGLKIAKELAEEADKSKTWFLSRVSHELRTPLNAILGFGEFLEESELNERQKDDVSQITSCGRHLLELINDVLDISKFELGNRMGSLETVDLSEVLTEAVTAMRPSAVAHGVSITLRTDEHVLVIADRRRLRQIVINLVSNAIKYNVTGGSVTVSASGKSDTGYRVSVVDTGIGMTEEQMERLFTPFDRLGADRSRAGGTGLGLVLARALVESMGGRLEVTSNKGAGSCFEFSVLPSSHVLSPIHGQSDGLAEASAQRSETRRMLVVEDSPLNVRLLKGLYYDRKNVEIDVVTCGPEAIERVRKTSPDIVLLDLNAPDVHGLEFLQTLKADELLNRIPVIVLTSTRDPQRELDLMRAGAFAHVSKPVIVSRLFEAVGAAMEVSGRAA